MQFAIKKPSLVTFSTNEVGEAHYVYATAEDYSTTYTQKRVSSLSYDSSYDGENPWFAFFVEDCFDPSIHIIQAPTFEVAYEDFVDQEAERGHYVLKREEYDSDAAFEKVCAEATCSSDGKPVCTETFHGFEVYLVSATR